MPTALITGGSRGFGRALAAALADKGWDLVVDARNRADLDAAAAQLSRAGTTVRAVAGDVADAGHRTALVRAAEELGGLDLLVNNASMLGPSPLPALADYPLDVLRHVLDVNVVGPLGLIQLALPLLQRSNGVVVDVTSDAAVEGYEGWGGYGASKAALDQLGNVLAAEHPDLRVYRFDPGDMRTQMHQEAFPGEDISDRPEPEAVVPALLVLLRDAPPSGRYRAADLPAEARR
ncbi:MAG: SDR family oxidoreductase [Acidimicrobiia bacterium]|nr:SDR family oxidoreductase [Acidimicrobiia bacterium]